MLTTSHPSSAKALPTEPVPDNSSNKRGILAFHVALAGEPDHGNEGLAGWEAAAVKMAAKQAPAMFQAQGHPGQRALLGQRGQAHRGA